MPGQHAPEPVAAPLIREIASRRRIPEQVSLDELFTGSADPAAPGGVLRPSLRMLLLFVTVTGASCGVLLTDSVAVKTAALSVAGLVLLVRLSKVPRGPVPGA
jgi:hypothetical protein